MKNKEKYTLTDLEIRKSHKHRSSAYALSYITKIYVHDELVGRVEGGSVSDLLWWLEQEYEGKETESTSA